MVIRHADTLICLQLCDVVLTLRLSVYTLFGKNKIKFWQKFFASPKIALAHTYENNSFICAYNMFEIFII